MEELSKWGEAESDAESDAAADPDKGNDLEDLLNDEFGELDEEVQHGDRGKSDIAPPPKGPAGQRRGKAPTLSLAGALAAASARPKQGKDGNVVCTCDICQKTSEEIFYSRAPPIASDHALFGKCKMECQHAVSHVSHCRYLSKKSVMNKNVGPIVAGPCKVVRRKRTNSMRF